MRIYREDSFVIKLPVKHLIYLLILFPFILIANSVYSKTVESPKEWPRIYLNSGNRLAVHQFQLDDWGEYLLLRGKTAVEVQLKGDERKYYGAMHLEASTAVDFESRIVFLNDFKITSLTFPNIDSKLADKCEKAVKSALPVGGSMTVSLDRVLAGIERTKQQTRTISVNLDPPPIHYSDKPAVLINFMGEPKFEAVKGGGGLLFAVNTNWDILLEVGSSKYYLLNGDNWLVTGDIAKGPWKTARSLPKSFNKLPNNDNWKEVKKNIPGKKGVKVPKVYVSTKPAELILTEGAPEYTPISGSKLLFIANTESDIFLHSPTSIHYFLTSGRWFKAKKLGGKWSAASKNLPKDFSKIPVDHLKSHVLSSVPGTPEADAAVLLASLPRKATVSRKTTKVTVVYEGDPEFILIKGTGSPVYFAVNSPYNIFQVEKMYYCVHDGIWFNSSSPQGPWLVSTEIPKVLYTIPSDHPKHNVTYVYIYDSTPDTVVVGYTSGYSGTYVATTGVIMFGVGYWIIHDDYYHYHHYHYHSHYYSYGSAYHYSYYYGSYYRSASHYGPHGGAGGWAGYDPGSGTYYRGGYAYGPHGSAFARQAYNPYSDRYGAQVGAKTPYGSWGRSVVSQGDEWARGGHRVEGDKGIGGIKTSRGGKVIAGYNKETGRGGIIGKDQHGDLYLGKDGSVYKREDNNWQKNSREGWENVETREPRKTDKSREARPARQQPDRSAQLPVTQGRQGDLNREYQKRSYGNNRANTYNQGSYGGGQSSYGGGSRSRGSFGGGRSRRR